MAIVIKPITVEVSKPNVFQAIAAKQNDSNSRFLKVTFVNEGEKITVPSSAKVTINAERKDGKSNSFFGAVNDDGTAIVPIHSWILELPGYVDCDVSIIEEDSKLTCTTFSLLVEEASHGSDDISEDEQYDVLTDLINQVDNVVSSAASAVPNTVSGSAIAIGDISPIKHAINVKTTPPKTFESAPYLYSDLSCETPITEWVDTGGATGEDVPIESSGYFSVMDINKFIAAAKAKGVDFSSAQEFVVECDFEGAREDAVYNTLYLNGTAIASDTFSAFEEVWGIAFEYVQSPASKIYTKFTVTDSDMSAVKLFACGKNFAQINSIKTPISSDKPIIFSGRITGEFILSCSLNCSYTHATATLFEVIVDGVSKLITPNALLHPHLYCKFKGTITQIKMLDYSRCQEGSVDNIQLELGTAQTAFEPHKEPTTYQMNEDGTVEGVKSIYPSMSLVTDTEGVPLDVTYNVDTKKYIDNKIAEVAAAIINK